MNYTDYLNRAAEIKSRGYTQKSLEEIAKVLQKRDKEKNKENNT